MMPGCEPFSSSGGDDGVLVLHGFTGTPASMRAIAELLAGAGLTVELPLLPGHGTSLEEMAGTRWKDWSGEAERAYLDLAARCDQVAVVGLSMGGTLACWLATRHPDIVGLAVVNPFVAPADPALRELAEETLAGGTEIAPSIGSDIAMPGVAEIGYDGVPIRSALSLFDAVEEIAQALDQVHCPVLLLSSREDHVVPSTAGDHLMAATGGPIERVWLERSYHVATLDYDREEIESRVQAFVAGVFAGSEP